MTQVLEVCKKLKVETVLPESEVEKHSLGTGDSYLSVVKDLADVEVDFCIAFGGDGTILRAFNRFRDMQTPILGVNLGRIGFLSAIEPENLSEDILPYLRGEYELMELSLLELELEGAYHLALNDLVVQKPDGGSVIQLGYQVGEVEMDLISCDGLVVATPAGSTAYNLSTGGPLISLGLEAMSMTAIAPHTLHSRALILGPGDTLRITNHTLGADALIYVDGRNSGGLAPDSSLTVSLAGKKAKLVKPFGADFYHKLREKFIKP